MAKLMIRCPETGRAISTGIDTDRDKFKTMPVFFADTYCPICRTPHKWFAKNAWVYESDTSANAETIGSLSLRADRSG